MEEKQAGRKSRKEEDEWLNLRPFLPICLEIAKVLTITWNSYLIAPPPPSPSPPPFGLRRGIHMRLNMDGAELRLTQSGLKALKEKEEDAHPRIRSAAATLIRVGRAILNNVSRTVINDRAKLTARSRSRVWQKPRRH